jgi:hypothetical protein
LRARPGAYTAPRGNAALAQLVEHIIRDVLAAPIFSQNLQ